jgi:hypothetical protein
VQPKHVTCGAQSEFSFELWPRDPVGARRYQGDESMNHRKLQSICARTAETFSLSWSGSRTFRPGSFCKKSTCLAHRDAIGWRRDCGLINVPTAKLMRLGG